MRMCHALQYCWTGYCGFDANEKRIHTPVYYNYIKRLWPKSEQGRAAFSSSRFKGNTRLLQNQVVANGEQMCGKLAQTKPHNAVMSSWMHSSIRAAAEQRHIQFATWILHWNFANASHTSSLCARDSLFITTWIVPFHAHDIGESNGIKQQQHHQQNEWSRGTINRNSIRIVQLK